MLTSCIKRLLKVKRIIRCTLISELMAIFEVSNCKKTPKKGYLREPREHKLNPLSPQTIFCFIQKSYTFFVSLICKSANHTFLTLVFGNGPPTACSSVGYGMTPIQILSAYLCEYCVQHITRCKAFNNRSLQTCC